MNPISAIKFTLFVWIVFLPFHAPAEVSPGADFDLQAYIDEAITNGATVIKLPEGRHRVAPDSNGSHLSLVGLDNITIDGTGSEMICTHTTRAISISNCTNLTIIGLTIDYDPLPFTQGRIVAMSEDKRTLWIELMNGYPDSDHLTGDKLEIYNFATGKLVANTYYGVSFEADGARGIVAVKSANNRTEYSHEEIGDVAVVGCREVGKNIPHGILVTACEGLVMDGVTLFASNMFGFFETDCSGSKYLNCVVDRRSLADDFKQREHPRMRSLTADAFHSKHASVGPTYNQCTARYMGDDGIAINGHYHIIADCDGARLRVIGKFGNMPNLMVGDPVELVSYAGERIQDAVITAFDQGPALNEDEMKFLEQQHFNGNVQTTRNAKEVYFVTLDREVDLPMGSLIASANRVGNGFEVRDCTIGPNRSRGILVKASDGIIAGNRLIDNWGQAIKLAPEHSWLEAGSGSNVTISDNTITGCRDAAIAVYANGGNGETALSGAHNDIVITGNAIRNSTNPAIAVTSTRGLKLYGNSIEQSNNNRLVPWILSQFGRREDPVREVYLENVDSVTGAPATKLEQWRDRYHLAQDGSEDLEDFSGDGIPPLIKLAFNLGNPRDRASRISYNETGALEHGGFPALYADSNICYNYIQLEDDNSGINYTCEFTRDKWFANWDVLADNSLMFNSITRHPVGDSGYELVSIRLSEDAIRGSYLRIRISRSSDNES